MKSRTLTEVLAQLYVAERFRLNPESAPWVNLSDSARRIEMGAMAEVVRTLGLFGWEVFEDDEGVGVRRIRVVEGTPSTSPPSGARGRSSSQQKGFTGIPCDACGSANTVRNGKCLLCMDCHASGECG